MNTLLRIFVALSLVTVGLADHHETTKAKLDEVMKLVGEHLTGATADALNDAAVRGLLDRLKPHVQLNPEATEPADETPLITRTNRFNRDFGYLRIARIEDELPAQTLEAIKSMLSDGPLRGMVFDLRFAGGRSYRAAANFAGLFAEQEPVMIKAADDEYRAAAGGDAILIPIMVLVNGQTSGAAEAAAASLREIKAGLIIGGPTAGMATVFEDFPLSTGDTLRIATRTVQLGGGQEIPVDGVSPDIEVKVEESDEKQYWEDPYFLSQSAMESASEISSRRVTEADLVRQRREGISLEQAISNRRNAPEDQPRTVQDPPLARALDLLKALSVVENWKQE